MKQLLSLLVVGLLYAAPLSAQAQVNIFACEPEWAALAEEIGGDKVEAFSATHAKQNPHHIRARPSLIAKARHADLILCSGAGLEVGWLPLLLRKAGCKCSARINRLSDGIRVCTDTGKAGGGGSQHGGRAPGG